MLDEREQPRQSAGDHQGGAALHREIQPTKKPPFATAAAKIGNKKTE